MRGEVLQAVTWLWTFSMAEPGTQEHNKKSKTENPFFTALLLKTSLRIGASKLWYGKVVGTQQVVSKTFQLYFYQSAKMTVKCKST